MEFKKSGFNEEDSATLAGVAAMYQNVADDAISAGESANFIISQMKAFGLEAEDATHIIDALNEVSNTQAVSSADLANNLGKASAAMALGNNTYEQSLAMMTAITEINRSGAKSARALVSVQSRLTQVLDEQSSTGKALVEIYNGLGIALKDQNGQLRPTFEIFKDLAKVWPNLTTNQRDYIALTQAGANQTSNFVALMNNFDAALKAEATAMESSGSAARENTAYMESLEAQTTQLKATFQDFANNVIDKELVSSILTLANDALGVLNTEVGSTITQWGLLTGVLTGGLTIFGQIGAKLFNAGKGILQLGKHLGVLASAFTGADITASAFAASAAPVAAVIAAIAVAVGLAVKHYKDVNQPLSEYTSQIESNTEQLEKNKERLEEIEKLPWTEKTDEILAEKEALEKQNAELEKNIELNKDLQGKAVDRTIGRTVDVYVGKQYGSANLTDARGNIEYFKTYEEALEALNEKYGETIVQEKNLADSIKSTGKYAESTGSILDTNYINILEDLADELASNNSLSDDSLELRSKNIDSIKEQVEAYQTAKDRGDDLTSSQERLIDAYNAFVEAEAEAKDWTEKYGDALVITDEQAKQLIKTFPSLKNQLIDTGSGWTILNNNAQTAANGLISADGRIKKSSRDRTKVVLEDLNATITYYGLIARAFNTMGTASGYTATQAKQANELARSFDATRKQLQAAIARGIYDDTGSNNTPLGTTAKKATLGATTKKATDLALEEFKNLQKDLEHQRELGLISEEEYYNKLEQLVKDYKAKATAHMKEYGTDVDTINRNMYQYEEEIYKGRTKLADDLAEQQKKATEDALEAQQKAAEEAAEALEKAEKEIKQAYEDMFEYLIGEIDEELDVLNEQLDEIDKKYDDELKRLEAKNELTESQVELEEKLNKLAKARSQKLLVYKDGRFQYISDVDTISQATEELEEYNRQQLLKQQKEDIENRRELEKKDIQSTIDALEKKKKAFNKFLDDYRDYQQALDIEQKLGINLEKDNWKSSLSNLHDYMTEYDSILGQISSSLEASVETQKQLQQSLLDNQLRLQEESIKAQDEYISKLAERNKIKETLLSGGKVPFTTWDGSQGNIYLDYNQDFVAKNALEEVLGYYLEDVGDYYNPWADYDKAIESVLEEARLGGYEPRQDLLESLRQQKANQDAARAQGLISGHGSSTIIYGGIGWDSSDNEDYTNWGESGFNNHYHDDDDDDYDDRYQTHTGSTVYQDAYDKYISEGDYESAKEVIEEAEARGQTVNKHASGTLSSAGGLSLVGEKGPELRVLNSGDGIIPADATRNLWNWAKFSPKEFNGGTMIHIANLNLPNVRDGNDFVKYMVNNFWRETVQYAST